jgi:hypothetical protein
MSPGVFDEGHHLFSELRHHPFKFSVTQQSQRFITAMLTVALRRGALRRVVLKWLNVGVNATVTSCKPVMSAQNGELDRENRLF